MSWLRSLADPFVGGVVLGIGVVVAGFVTLALAWRGAAATLIVPKQLAWVISGGAAALCLVGVGLAVVSIQVDRRNEAVRRHRLDTALADAVDALAATRSRHL